MPHKLRKVRKKRGTRTQGYGRVGQHRKSGGKGYRKVGRHKHGWSYVHRFMPNYFKRESLKSIKGQTKEQIINLKNLEDIATQLLSERKKKSSKILIDLKERGYCKLLGTGKITMPLSVKVSLCSKTAKKKIEKAGGEVFLIN
jgi:large subunit ribosomal protein L15